MDYMPLPIIDRQTKQKLADAQFLVKKNDQYLAQENGINHWVAKDDSRATIFTSSKDGTFSVHGLSFGSYELVEIKPPKGYILGQSTILFEVEKGSYDRSRAHKHCSHQCIQITISLPILP